MKLICLGDSFTVGPMVDSSQRWSALLQEGSAAQVINRGISGDTTSGMLARLMQNAAVLPLP